jgi:hydroxypyruvate isomerase
MPRFAANLSLMYTEAPFLERFALAAHDGFTAVEYLFPYEHPAALLRERLDAHGMQQVLFNASPGDFATGERGLACVAGREDDFRRSIDQALPYASTLACPRIHVMAGLFTGDRVAAHAKYVDNIAWAAKQAASANVDVLIEPINTRDMPGYFLNRQQDAHDIVTAIGAKNLKVQMDLYHCQIVEGDVAMKLRQYLPTGRVAHLQIAGVPQRHEPDLGELNFDYLFDVIDELSFDGFIGCEYRPLAGTSQGLGWLRRR